MKENDKLVKTPSKYHALDYIIKKTFSPRSSKTSAITHNVYCFNKEDKSLNFLKIGEAISFGNDLIIKLKPNINASGELYICQKD